MKNIKKVEVCVLGMTLCVDGTLYEAEPQTEYYPGCAGSFDLDYAEIAGAGEDGDLSNILSFKNGNKESVQDLIE